MWLLASPKVAHGTGSKSIASLLTVPAQRDVFVSCKQGGYAVLAERFYVGRHEPVAVVPAKDVLEADDERGPESDQVHALPEEIADRTVFLGVDVPLRKDPQPQHLGEPEGVVLIVGEFQPGVLLDRRRISQMYLVACLHEEIDQPVPIVRGLDDNAGNVILVWLYRLQYALTLIRQLLFEDPLAGFIDDAELTVA